MSTSRRVVGRYVLHDAIGSGGMAAVHVARLVGDAGFSRTVAIKCMHGHLARDPEFVAMFQDEARLTARVHHPNVIPVLDVVALDGELFIVMDYVAGETLSKVLSKLEAAGRHAPLNVTSAIVLGVLYGLHAAHEATSETRQPLQLIHRDVSPPNVLVGADGVTRVLDFGIAKAVGRQQITHAGQVKGKAGYMSPEQLRGASIDRRVDVYASAVVLWEMLTSQRLFEGATPEATVNRVFERAVPPPSAVNPAVPPRLDALVLRGLARNANDRFTTALEMATALESVVVPATPREVGEWLESVVGEVLAGRAKKVASIETISEPLEVSPAPAPPPRRSRAVVYAAAAGIAVIAIMMLAARTREPSVETQAASPSPPATSAAPTVAAVAPSVVPIPSTTPEAPPDTPRTPRTVVRKAPPRMVRSCQPPYVIDDSGFRSPKPECL